MCDESTKNLRLAIAISLHDDVRAGSDALARPTLDPMSSACRDESFATEGQKTSVFTGGRPPASPVEPRSKPR